MNLDFVESEDCGEWLCTIQLPDFDPFGKGNLTISIEDLDAVSPSLGPFADEFVQRYREFWPRIEALLMDWGWSWSELCEAHEETRIDLEDGSSNPPDSWTLTFYFLFDDGYTFDLSLEFEGWSPDDRLVGGH